MMQLSPTVESPVDLFLSLVNESFKIANMGIHSEHRNLQGKQITVMGLGHFGGNIAAIRYLHKLGARLTVTDLTNKSDLQKSIDQISSCNLEALHLGKHRESDFKNKDLIVVSPAIPPENPFIQLAIKNGIPITTEMNLFWQINPAPVIAVTGSNGKSTTSGMIHSILTQAGFRSHLGGNIGHSLLEKAQEFTTNDVVVLELSSFQLEYLEPLHPAPKISVITGFSPNHLDWHGSLENYEKAKINIVRWQNRNQYSVIPANHKSITHWKTQAKIIPTDINRNLRDALSVPGEHNLMNASLASEAAKLFGASEKDVLDGLRLFQGLPHRLEKVATIQHRTFYNDSLATTPESAIAAIQSFDRPLYLIAGGYDKKIDLSLFAKKISESVKGVALIGQTAEPIKKILDENNSSTIENIENCKTLENAFRQVWKWSTPGSVILLSPGCASYDQFTNFRERGDRFKKLVHDLDPS